MQITNLLAAVALLSPLSVAVAQKLTDVKVRSYNPGSLNARGAVSCPFFLTLSFSFSSIHSLSLLICDAFKPSRTHYNPLPSMHQY